MLFAAYAVLLIGTPAQVIDGIKPIFDPTPQFAKAFVSRSQEDPSILQKADPFLSAFFMSKAKTMSALTHTKYTAAQMGICGTIVGVYDSSLGSAIRAGSDRISKGSKDFDSLTEEERSAIQKAHGASSLVIVGNRSTTPKDQWQFFAGTHLGMLTGYVTVWHISPKQATLLQFISDGAKACADHGAKAEAGGSEIGAALKGFSKFTGKTVDEATAREIGSQIEVVLKAATPLKYRW